MKKSQFKVGVVLAYILIFVNLIYGFFISPFLIQKLTSANYGAYKTISSLIGTVSVLDFGISSTVIRYLSKFFAEKDEKSSRSFLGMIVYQVAFIILVIVAVGLVLYFCLDTMYGTSDLGLNVDPGLSISKKLFIMLLINTIINVPCSVFNAIIVANKDYLFANLSKILRILFQFVALIVIVPLPFWHGSTLSVGVVLIATSFLFLLIDLIYVIFKIRVKINFKIKLIPQWIIKESLIFTLLSFIQTILVQFEGNIDNILIGKFIGPEAVTTYSLAILFYSVFNQLSTAISSLLLPSVSQKIAEGATNRDLENLTIKVGRIQFMVLGGALFGFIACGRMFISLWVGESQLLVWVLGMILMTATLFPLVENTALAIIRAKNKILFRTIAVLIGTLFNFSITLISVWLLDIDPKIKLVLACVGTAASLIGANVVAMNIYYKKILDFRPLRIFKSIFKRTIFCLIPPSIVTFLFTLFLGHSWMNFVCVVVLFIAVYACCLFFFGMSDEEKDVLFGKFVKFTNHKEYRMSKEKKLILFPDDFLHGLSHDEIMIKISKNIDYPFNQTAPCTNDAEVVYDDGICLVLNQSNRNDYNFINYFKKQEYKRVIIICHREYFKFYKKDYGVDSFLKTPIFSNTNRFLLKPRKKSFNVKLSKKQIIKNVLISVSLASFSFGLSYVLVDYSPEKASTFIADNYSQPVYCRFTPSSYPTNPFFSETFNANQASTPSLEFFYSQSYLKNNTSLYLYEKTEDFSPFQYKYEGQYIDSTLITSNYISLNDESCFSKLGLDLVAGSADYSDEDENVVVINDKLAINLFGSTENAINNTLEFYLYGSQKVRTGRKFKVVGVFEYTDCNTYYSYNKSPNLFVTNPKTVSMGWSGFEYLFSLPDDLDLLSDSLLKIFQIENTYAYSHSFFTLSTDNHENNLLDITNVVDKTIKKYDSPFEIAKMSIVIIAYVISAVLLVRETNNIKRKYFETMSKRRVVATTLSVFLLVSLGVDLVLLYLLDIRFVWKIIVLPLIVFLIVSLVMPMLFANLLKDAKK